MKSKYVSHHISSMGVSHEGKYCIKFLNQYSFICSKFYKLYKYNINISHNKTTWINGIIRNNKCIFTKLNAVFILKTAAWTKKNITTVNSVTNTWSIQQTPIFHCCTITNKQNIEPWKLSTSWGRLRIYIPWGAAIRLYFTVFLLARSNPRDIPFSNILISKNITDLVCCTYFHWFFNPECQHIFGKQTGIYFSPQSD
jgi:hypothetical protein